MKKALSIVLSLSMLLICTPLAYAESETGSEISLEQYVDYAYSILPDLAKLPDVDFPLTGLYISQPIEILNDNDDANYAFFLFNQESCIGELAVSYVENDFCASFLYEDMPAVSAAYIGSIPISLVSMNNALLMCSESSREVIVGSALMDSQEEASITQFQNDRMDIQLQGEELLLMPIAPIEEPYSYGWPSSRVLDVPFVANGYANGEGICWAASAASIIRYLTGNTVVTANGLYNTVLVDTGMTSGYNEAVVYGLTAYGVNYYTGLTSSLPFSTVINQINADYPIYIAIRGKKNGDWAYHHAVVICGYMCESDGIDYYEFMDPNISTSKVWIIINRSSNAFTYVTPSHGTYTDWYWTVCSSLV